MYSFYIEDLDHNWWEDPVLRRLPARRYVRLRRPLLDGRRRQGGRPEGTQHQEQRLTVTVFPTFLEELEARTAIEDCLKRFARAVDRQDWKAARELYHPDAFDDHGFFKGPPDAFLAHIEKLHAEQEHSMHFNTNVLIEFSSTGARVRRDVRAGAAALPRRVAEGSGRRRGPAQSRLGALPRPLRESAAASGASRTARWCSATSSPRRCTSRCASRRSSPCSGTTWTTLFTC